MIKADTRNGRKKASRRAEVSALYDDQTDLQTSAEQAYIGSDGTLLQADDEGSGTLLQGYQERRRKANKARMKDASVLLIPSDHDGDEVQYWREFQAYYLDHYDPAVWSDRTVNGISIFCDRFAERVIESLFRNRVLIIR